MADPLQSATASAPPVLGQGCTRRYDPQAMTADMGCDFASAQQLWQQLHGMPPGEPAQLAEDTARQ